MRLTSTMLIVLTLTSGLLTGSTSAQDYEITWSTIDCGGGTSTGDDFALSGTIGQPDVGAIAGGDYKLFGGFWPGGTICFVNLEHFARFASYWLDTGPDIPADLYKDNIINELDLMKFADYWLWYCPYNWPLK